MSTVDPITNDTDDPEVYEFHVSYSYHGCSPRAGGPGASESQGVLAWLLPLAAALAVLSSVRGRKAGLPCGRGRCPFPLIVRNRSLRNVGLERRLGAQATEVRHGHCVREEAGTAA